MSNPSQQPLPLSIRHISSLESSIEDVPKSPISRKRRYHEEMSDKSLEASQAELAEIKGRNVSPATATYLTKMIEVCKTMREMDKDEPEYSNAKVSLGQYEAALDARLAKDRKYRNTLLEFRAMETNTLLLRYSDYLAHHCNAMKQKSREQSKTQGTVDGLGGLNWQQVDQQMKNEEEEFEKWRPFSKDPMPSSPMTNFIEHLAEECLIPLKDAKFSIRWYANRCGIAHSGVEEAVATEDLNQIANFILRDREAILNGVLVGEVADSASELLSALQLFEKSYFKGIHTRETEAGLKVVTWYDLSDEFKEREQKKEEAKVKKQLQSMTLNDVAYQIKRAKDTTSIDPAVQSAIVEVVEAEEERDEISVELKALQEKYSAAERKLKESALKFKNLCPEKK